MQQNTSSDLDAPQSRRRIPRAIQQYQNHHHPTEKMWRKLPRKSPRAVGCCLLGWIWRLVIPLTSNCFFLDGDGRIISQDYSRFNLLFRWIKCWCNNQSGGELYMREIILLWNDATDYREAKEIDEGAHQRRLLLLVYVMIIIWWSYIRR